MTAAGGCALRLACDGSGGLGIGGWGAGESVCYNVFHPWHILDFSCILSYIAKLPLLPLRPGVSAAAEGIGEGVMICPQLKLPTLYLKRKCLMALKAVKHAVRDLRVVHLFGEESQWLPGVANEAALMKGYSYMTGTGVCHHYQLC